MNKPAIGIASREGSRGRNCDAAHVYQAEDGTIVAAVVDGVGDAPELPEIVSAIALTITRVGYRRGGLAGMLAASDLLLDEHEAVAVTARIDPDGHLHVHWVGDCRAWVWTGEELRQLTTDHTMGQMLRASGGEAAERVAATHDHWQRLALSCATPTTVAEVRGVMLDAGHLVLLTSDGVHSRLPESVIADLVAKHSGDPQRLADRLVHAVNDDAGDRDDATAVVISGRR